MEQTGQRRHVSKEQIERAKQMDLLSYMQAYEPHELAAVKPACVLPPARMTALKYRMERQDVGVYNVLSVSIQRPCAKQMRRYCDDAIAFAAVSFLCSRTAGFSSRSARFRRCTQQGFQVVFSLSWSASFLVLSIRKAQPIILDCALQGCSIIDALFNSKNIIQIRNNRFR